MIKLEDYKFIKRIGKGGMGEVWLAEHTVLKTKVAIKSLDSNLINDERFRQRFRKEATIHNKLSHPNIVKLIDFQERPDGVFLIMNYIEGKQLNHYIQKTTGPIPEKELIPLFLQILSAIKHAHSKGLIHRDIKPSNILITKEGKIKVIDFGIAKSLDEWIDKGLTVAGDNPGTPAYMSPEQVNAEKLDVLTDIYSLGVTLFQMVVGRGPYFKIDGTPKPGYTSPFKIQTSIVGEPLPNPKDIYPGSTERLISIINKATQKKKSKRFQSCDEFIKSFDEKNHSNIKENTVKIPQVKKPTRKKIPRKPILPIIKKFFQNKKVLTFFKTSIILSLLGFGIVIATPGIKSAYYDYVKRVEDTDREKNRNKALNSIKSVIDAAKEVESLAVIAKNHAIRTKEASEQASIFMFQAKQVIDQLDGNNQAKQTYLKLKDKNNEVILALTKSESASSKTNEKIKIANTISRDSKKIKNEIVKESEDSNLVMYQVEQAKNQKKKALKTLSETKQLVISAREGEEEAKLGLKEVENFKKELDSIKNRSDQGIINENITQQKVRLKNEANSLSIQAQQLLRNVKVLVDNSELLYGEILKISLDANSIEIDSDLEYLSDSNKSLITNAPRKSEGLLKIVKEKYKKCEAAMKSAKDLSNKAQLSDSLEKIKALVRSTNDKVKESQNANSTAKNNIKSLDDLKTSVSEAFGELIEISNYKNGKLDQIVLANGDKYEGDWFVDKITGKGIMTYSNGNIYNGDFFEGKRSGNGTMTYPSGATYNGAWDNDMRNGQGRYAQNRISLSGNWINNNLDGLVIEFKNGQKSEVKYVNGKREHTVNGIVRNNQNNDIIIGAQIQVIGTRQIQLTDNNGKYTIKVLHGQTLSISHPGYQKVIKQITGSITFKANLDKKL